MSIRALSAVGGQRLVLYTDGVVEGRAAPDTADRLGVHGLLSILDAVGLSITAQQIIETATAHRGAGLPDDAACVLLTRQR